jgi:hypothetical protein
MGLETVTAQEWLDRVKQRASKLPNDLGDCVRRFELTPAGMPLEDIEAGYQKGGLSLGNDFRPKSILTAVDGDLAVDGLVSTQGEDGNATLIVFGDLRCRSLINDWGSIVIVTGSLIADEWVYAAREDSSLIVGGNFKTPIFIGADIELTVGGILEADYAYGYATSLPESGQVYGKDKSLENRSWREIAARLGLGHEVTAEDALMQAIDLRVITTESLLPR